MEVCGDLRLLISFKFFNFAFIEHEHTHLTNGDLISSCHKTREFPTLLYL